MPFGTEKYTSSSTRSRILDHQWDDDDQSSVKSLRNLCKVKKTTILRRPVQRVVLLLRANI